MSLLLIVPGGRASTFSAILRRVPVESMAATPYTLPWPPYRQQGSGVSVFFLPSCDDSKETCSDKECASSLCDFKYKESLPKDCNIDLHEGTIILSAFSESARSFFRMVCDSRPQSLYATKNDKKEKGAAQIGVDEKQL
jgi:hypothetical protein